MQKKNFLFASILGILALSSCSQEVEESQEQQRKELRSSSNIKTGAKSCMIDIPNMISDVYQVTLLENGNIIDVRKVRK